MPEMSAKRYLSCRSSRTATAVYVFGQQMASTVSTVGRGAAISPSCCLPLQVYTGTIIQHAWLPDICKALLTHAHSLLPLNPHQSLAFKAAHTLTHSHPRMHRCQRACDVAAHQLLLSHCAHARMHLQRVREIINIHAKQLSKACLQNQ